MITSRAGSCPRATASHVIIKFGSVGLLEICAKFMRNLCEIYAKYFDYFIIINGIKIINEIC